MNVFDSVGRLLFQKNSPWVFLGFLLLPFCVLFVSLAPHFFQLKELEQTLDSTALRSRPAFERFLEKEVFLKRHSHSEPYFLEQNIEPLRLLQNNLDQLSILNHHPACRNQAQVIHRISFLESAKNCISFSEENLQSTKTIREAEERLVHPVEVDADSLEQLLSIIEDISIGSHAPKPLSPQLIIRDFSLKKQPNSLYELDFTLIKREFLHE